ncbi:hypothetical protein DMN91_000663 [Ooceraea biroi]|uniref:Small integral membrane protein 14 n=1 Tax=Ooceraea biroi TaxID=2015173 RepID=A0A3L8E399_OOCBI|nr:small integral membrane protein 14 [Ooceraea biroi]RLU26865.1 hypothetical protein DMN91_000663 [Ooceraea biroi]
MSDECDPCEYMWNYLSMQHLLSILRRSQDYCSDTECFSVSRIPGPQAPVREPSDFLFTCIILTVIVLMYAFRTRLTSPQSSGHTVKNYNEPGSQNGPPSPPTGN